MGSDGEPVMGLMPYLQHAEELQKHEPVVAYYCRLYAMEKGLRILEKECTSNTKSFINSLMNQLEKEKNILSLEPDDHIFLEEFACNFFAKADKQDCAGQADINTAKTFYASSIFFEILNQFGQLRPDIELKQRYAIWKAAEIRKALNEGRKPECGPPGTDKDVPVTTTTSQVPFEANVCKQMSRVLDLRLQCGQLVYGELLKMSHRFLAAELQRFKFWHDGLNPTESIKHITKMKLAMWTHSSHPMSTNWCAHLFPAFTQSFSAVDSNTLPSPTPAGPAPSTNSPPSKSTKRDFALDLLSKCWEKADCVPGRHPYRWRMDPAGNILCFQFWGHYGVHGYEFDHIEPYVNDGPSDVKNCQVLQTLLNRSKGKSHPFDKEAMKDGSVLMDYTENELDFIEISVWGGVDHPGRKCRVMNAAEKLLGVKGDIACGKTKEDDIKF